MKHRTLDEVAQTEISAKLAPLNFSRIDGEFLITNMLRQYIYIDESHLVQLLSGQLDVSSTLYKELCAKFFIMNEPVEIFASRAGLTLRKILAPLFWGTALHIFVVTNECNLSCCYCQAVASGSSGTRLMSIDTAKASVNIALSSPCRELEFEFQGGEPLLNFEAIKAIVTYAKQQAQIKDKTVKFSLVSNFSFMKAEVVEFLCENDISVCVSLDGPKHIHDYNRPWSGGSNYESVIKWINYCKKQMEGGAQLSLSAIPTITRRSLPFGREIVDHFIELGFNRMSLRFLSPLGRAKDNWNDIGYTPEEYGAFYNDTLEYMIQTTNSGKFIREGFATMVTSMSAGLSPVNYMEMRSPCGAGIGQIAYHWNGDVYTCDEARMLGERGDPAFRLGSVHASTYDELISNNTLKAVALASIIESAPDCETCAFSPFCGLCPVYNHDRYGSIARTLPGDYRCEVMKTLLHTILKKLSPSAGSSHSTLLRWANI